MFFARDAVEGNLKWAKDALPNVSYFGIGVWDAHIKRVVVRNVNLNSHRLF